jgi:hypothetical protein
MRVIETLKSKFKKNNTKKQGKLSFKYKGGFKKG